MDRYYASASFGISAEIINPPVDLFMLKDMKDLNQLKNRMLVDFEDPSDFKNISEAELTPVKEQVKSFVKSAAELTSKYLNGDFDKNQI